MLHHLTPILRSDLAPWHVTLDQLAPTLETHPSLVWLARAPDDDRPLGAYIREQRLRSALGCAGPGRLVVLSDDTPSTLSSLIALQNRTRTGVSIPLHAVFPEHALDLQGAAVERVIPCRLFDADQCRRLRVRYGTDLSATTVAALPSDAWHVAMVHGRTASTPWLLAVALMDSWCFWTEVVERHWLHVAALLELNFTHAQAAYLRYVATDGLVHQLYPEMAHWRLGWRETERAP